MVSLISSWKARQPSLVEALDGPDEELLVDERDIHRSKRVRSTEVNEQSLADGKPQGKRRKSKTDGQESRIVGETQASSHVLLTMHDRQLKSLLISRVRKRRCRKRRGRR